MEARPNAVTQGGELEMKVNYETVPLDGQTWRIDETFSGMHTYAYLLEGRERALLIDTCQGWGGLPQQVKRLTDKPVTVVHTHGHLDHIGADGAFGKAYVSTKDMAVAQEHSGYAYRRASLLGFDEELELGLSEAELDRLVHGPDGTVFLPMEPGEIFDLGGRKIEVLATPGHTPGSVCFLERERRALYTGDTVCARGILLSLPHSCSVACFEKSVQYLAERLNEYDLLHPGHHEVPLHPEILQAYIECAKAIQSGALAGDSGSAAGAACLYAAWQNIGIAYQADRIVD